MAEEKVELQNVNFRQLLPFTELFRGFGVARAFKKLLLAAAGIVVMAFGWWLLAIIFLSMRTPPDLGSGNYNKENWDKFKEDRRQWNILYEAAGPDPLPEDANDIAAADDNFEEFKEIKDGLGAIESAIKKGGKTEKQILAEIDNGEFKTSDGAKVSKLVGRKWQERKIKPYGKMRTWPWFEDRGPNPYLLITGNEGQSTDTGTSYFPWEKGHFGEWFLFQQVPVLIEPLVKFFRPVLFLLKRGAGFLDRIYFTCVLLWTLATWAVFGGAITRLAAVEVARKEKLPWGEGLHFARSRFLSFFSAPLFPLIGVLVIVVLLVIFGLFHLIPGFGDLVVDGLGWPLVLAGGLAMAIILVGLVGWPMMYATISAEGSDSFDALSRSYTYVYQNPWHYLWYCLVSLAYGAVVVFFVGLIGSMAVYLGQLGVSQTPGIDKADRNPAYLFIYAPESFGWKELLLRDSRAQLDPVTKQIPEKYFKETEFHWWNYVAAFMVAFWLYLLFLMVVGFGYSYFWSASTIIYLLMRKVVDDTDLDEVYLEEEEYEDTYSTQAPAPAAAPATGSAPITMIEPPALKPAAPPPPPAPPPTPTPTPAPAPARVESTPPVEGDGNPPVG